MATISGPHRRVSFSKYPGGQSGKAVSARQLGLFQKQNLPAFPTGAVSLSATGTATVTEASEAIKATTANFMVNLKRAIVRLLFRSKSGKKTCLVYSLY